MCVELLQRRRLGSCHVMGDERCACYPKTGKEEMDHEKEEGEEEKKGNEGEDGEQGAFRPPGSSLERLQLAPLRRALPRWGPRGRGARQ